MSTERDEEEALINESWRDERTVTGNVSTSSNDGRASTVSERSTMSTERDEEEALLINESWRDERTVTGNVSTSSNVGRATVLERVKSIQSLKRNTSEKEIRTRDDDFPIDNAFPVPNKDSAIENEHDEEEALLINESWRDERTVTGHDKGPISLNDDFRDKGESKHDDSPIDNAFPVPTKYSTIKTEHDEEEAFSINESWRDERPVTGHDKGPISSKDDFRDKGKSNHDDVPIDTAIPLPTTFGTMPNKYNDEPLSWSDVDPANADANNETFTGFDHAFGYMNERREYMLVACTLTNDNGELMLVGASGHNYGTMNELNITDDKEAMLAVDKKEWEHAFCLDNGSMGMFVIEETKVSGWDSINHTLHLENFPN